MTTRIVRFVVRRFRHFTAAVRHAIFPPTLLFIGIVTVALLGWAFIETYAFASRWWHNLDEECGDSTLGCGLVVHVVGTGIVAAIVFYVVFLGRGKYAALWWRWRAYRTPEKLFARLPPFGGVTGLAARSPSTGWRRFLRSHRPRSLRRLRLGSARSVADNVISRKALVRELSQDLRAGGTCQVLVGPTGSGKTMVLLKLAQHLARRGQLPVVTSLRDDESGLDFEERARKAYRRAFPKYTEEQADKHWRWHRRGDLITVLVDDLEKASYKPGEVIEALDRARRDGLRLIAASRPSGVPPEFKQGRIDLEPLDTDEVEEALLKRAKATARGPLDMERLKQVIRTIACDAEIPRTPYYLAIARVLADTGSLSHLGLTSGIDARLVLLDAYREDQRAGRSRGDSGLDEKTRTDILEGLEAIALVSLGKAETVHDIDTAMQGMTAFDLQTRKADWWGYGTGTIVEYGQRLGVLEKRYDDVVRFGHPTTLAFFASCYLAKRKGDSELWQKFLDTADLGASTSLTLVFANAAAHDPSLADFTCKALLDRVMGTGDGKSVDDDDPNPNTRLIALNAAEEIARANGAWNGALAERIVRGLETGRDDGALPLAQIRLVEELGSGLSPDGSTPSGDVYRKLWEFTTDKKTDYLVRRASMRALLKTGEAAVTPGLEFVREVMDQAEKFRDEHRLPVNDDRFPLFDLLRAVAWMLPGLRSAATTKAEADELAKHQRRIRDHANELTEQRGLESSIADGLKQDAIRDPDRGVDPFALDMLDPKSPRRAWFWFSRVLLVQAVARRCVGRDDALELRQRVFDAERDPHPFVREAARLCGDALIRGDWEPYIWPDMTEVAARGNARLATATKQLIGEMGIALNMNEHAPPEVRALFGTEPSLPACLEKSRNRAEILGLSGPRQDCPFLHGDKCLCPYTYNAPGDGIRRELSRAFCRDQRLHAQRLRHSDIHLRPLQTFWQEMESMARF